MDISGILASFEMTAKQNHIALLSMYASGSYANGYYLDGISDLDLLLIVDHASEGLTERFLENVEPQDTELDLCILEESVLRHNPNSIHVRECVMSSKLCGRLLWGADLLKSWDLPPMEEYTQRTVDMVFEFIRRAHGKSCDMRHLTYPDSDDPYFGYLVMRNGIPSTKQIISLYTWIATAQLAKYHAAYCGCKRDCLEQAMRFLEGSFASTLQQVYENCRTNWKYTVPVKFEDQLVLRRYCRELLKFEQDFVNEFWI